MKQPFQPNDMAVIWYIRDHCDGWPPHVKLCYMMLYSRMNADRWAWPSYATLAADMSVSRSAAIRAVRELKALGLIEAEEKQFRSEDGGQDTTRRRLKPPWEADYTRRPQYRQPSRTAEEGEGVSEGHGGECHTDTGGSVLQIQGECLTDTGPGVSETPEANHIKLTNKGEEEEVTSAPQETWYEFFEREFARTLNPTEFQRVAQRQERGVTDDLIIYLLQEAKRLKKRNKLGWAISVIADKIPEGVRTLDDWLRREREVAQAEQSKRPDKPDRRRPLRDPIATADTPLSPWEVPLLPEDQVELMEQATRSTRPGAQVAAG